MTYQCLKMCQSFAYSFIIDHYGKPNPNMSKPIIFHVTGSSCFHEAPPQFYLGELTRPQKYYSKMLKG